MKPLLHYSSSIIVFYFSFPLLIMFIINIRTCLCEDDEYTNCSTAFICGDSIKDLKYPFWGENREKYCGVGDSNTELTCENTVPKITINKVKYRILDWKNTTQKLTVARDDYFSGNVCTVNTNYKSSTFDNTKFQADSNDVANVTLLYGCDIGTGKLLSSFYDINCGGSRYVVYTVAHSASDFTLCSPTDAVVIPILETIAAQIISGKGALDNILKDSLQRGFDLKWIGSYAECQRCIDTGGVCGNEGYTEFRCFCNNGNDTASCNSEKASSPSMSIISLFSSSYFYFILQLNSI